MKNLLYLVIFIFLTIEVSAQSNQISKVILKNNDVLTGKIVEIKPGEYLKLEIVGNNIIQIPYSDIAQIVFDDKVTAAPTEVSKPF